MKISFLLKMTLLPLSLLIVSCYGRIDDGNQTQKFVFEETGLGLTASKPSVVVFGAGWCKPCRKEIEYLNEIKSQFGDKLQVVGYLVEGQTKGAAPTALALEEYASLNAIKPEYLVIPDTGWKKFLSTNPAKKSLPLMLFVNNKSEIEYIVQRSISFEDELLPLVEKLVRNEKINKTEPTTPTEPTIKPQKSYKTVAQWALIEEEKELLFEAYKAACNTEGFKTNDYNFETGQLTISIQNNRPTIGHWVSKTGCELTLYLDENLQYKSSKAFCI